MYNSIGIINTHIYSEVEILVASNWRPLVDKTLVVSNLKLITVSSNGDMFLFYTQFKIITLKIRSIDDVLLFSISQNVENNKNSKKRE